MSCYLIPMAQRTAEWYTFRRKGPAENPYACALGCSDLAVLAGVSPYATMVDLWRDKALGITRVVTAAETRIRAWGQRREPALLAEYRQRVQREDVVPAVTWNDDYPYLVASLDGFAWTGEPDLACEIKVAAMEYIERVKRWQLPEHWQAQILGQLLVTGLPFIHVVAEPFVGGATVTMTAELEDVTKFCHGDVEALLEKARAFCEAVTLGVKPGWMKGGE